MFFEVISAAQICEEKHQVISPNKFVLPVYLHALRSPPICPHSTLNYFLFYLLCLLSALYLDSYVLFSTTTLQLHLLICYIQQIRSAPDTQRAGTVRQCSTLYSILYYCNLQRHTSNDADTKRPKVKTSQGTKKHNVPRDKTSQGQNVPRTKIPTDKTSQETKCPKDKTSQGI